ncbi:hypothetical protein TWF506_006528 [Arthrobotrys conoides]|uniref:Uncharacterized protein n=1 Tax=Arthrobotrys conoides TaxID=74498 RepID=A0AAN8NHE5_9PEZI
MSDLTENLPLSEALGLIQEKLKETSDIVIKIQNRVSEFSVIITRLDGYFDDAEGFLKFIDNAARVINEGLALCKYLRRLIPIFGPVFLHISSAVERLRIEKTLQDVIQSVRDAIKKKGSAKISATLQKVVDENPNWRDMVNIAMHIFDFANIFRGLYECNDQVASIKNALTNVATDMSNNLKYGL